MSKESRRRAQVVPRSSASRSWPIAVVLLILVGVTLAVFWPVLTHQFVYFDDDVYVTENQHVLQGLSGPAIIWAFTTLKAGFWHPLTWLSLMLDRTLFGDWTAGFHLTNLLLHAASVSLLFLLLHRLTGARWRSAVVAALFALHPLHVEPVAWVAERKEVLGTFFGLLSLYFYAGHRPNPERKRYYWLSLGAFVLGLMSKPMLVTWPLVMLLLDFWPLKRIPIPGESLAGTLRSLLREKLPFFACAFAAGLVTLVAESKIGAVSVEHMPPFAARLVNTICSYGYYLRDVFWPARLAVFYPWPKTFPLIPIVGVAIGLLLISALAVRWARWQPYLFVGWFWYLITLLPVCGLLQVGDHSRADRYTYIPLTGVFIVLVWGGRALSDRLSLPPNVLRIAAVIILATLAIQTRRQLTYWQDSESLFTHAAAVTEDNYLAYNNLGKYCFFEGRLDEAEADYRKALAIKPDYATARVNLGAALRSQDRGEEAMQCFEQVLKTDPGHIGALNNLGNILAGKGRLVDAEEKFETVLKIDPDQNITRVNLGILLVELSRPKEGVAQFQEALRRDPNDARAARELKEALEANGKN